jgi:hypothetical protein
MVRHYKGDQMRKKSVTIKLDQDKLDYIDYIARQLDPVKPNRTKAVALLIDIVEGSFSDDMVLLHAQSVTAADSRNGEWVRFRDEAGNWKREQKN